jgi:hypothetical protein
MTDTKASITGKGPLHAIRRHLREVADHPSLKELKTFMEGGISLPRSREVALHVAECADCQHQALAFPPAPARVFGRPVHGVETNSPPAIERDVRRLTSWISRNQGAVLRLAGPWWAEYLVYQILAIALARSQKKQSYAVCGNVFLGTLPAVPETRVAVLLDAPSYKDVGAWARPHADLAIILVGESTAWGRVGQAANWTVTGNPDPTALEYYREKVRRAARSRNRFVRAAVLANALHMDWRSERLPRRWSTGLEAVFTPLWSQTGERLPWVCVRGGAWLAQSVLAQEPGLFSSLRGVGFPNKLCAHRLEVYGPF